MSEDKLIPVFTTLRERMKRSAAKILHSDSYAEDALQETFCRLWPRRDEIHTAQDAAALSAVTLRNVSIDMLRKQRYRHTEEIKPDTGVNAADAQNELERRERFEAVENIINGQLTEIQQTILRKKEYEGESLEEIARDTGLTSAAAAMQLSRARKIIREQFKRQNGHEI